MIHRVVSLLPAATEIVCALGAEASLVGRSHECDFPSSVTDLPVCSRPRIDVCGSSRDIDNRVKQALRDGLSIFEIDVERLNRLEPTLVLTQAQCDVCAVSLADVEAALASRVGSRPQVVSLVPNCLNDVLGDVRRVAEALDLVEQGELLTARLERNFEHLTRQGVLPNDHDRPSVVCLEWFEPLMTAGNWVPELVEIAGGRNLLSRAGQHSPWLEWHELIAADPDVLVLMPCGWSIPRARAESPPLISHPDWLRLKAVRAGRVFVVDGHHYFNRPGPRLVDSAAILVELLHPDLGLKTHRGSGWEPL